MKLKSTFNVLVIKGSGPRNLTSGSMNHTWCILQKYLNKMTSVIKIYHNCSMSPFLKDHPPQQPVALELAQVSLSSSSMEFSYSFVKSKVPNSELMDKTMEWNFKTIFKYVRNPRLLLTPIFLLLLVILDISDPPSQYLVNPWNPCAEKQGDDNFSSAFNYWSPPIKETASMTKCMVTGICKTGDCLYATAHKETKLLFSLNWTLNYSLCFGSLAG